MTLGVHHVPKPLMGRIVLLGVVLALVATPVQAGPTPAGDYHWARKDPQFTLQVGDNLDGAWSGCCVKPSPIGTRAVR